MSSEPITNVSARAIHIPGDDIDTDRIIPARFMKCITFDGLGEFLFHDVRKDEAGNKKEHNLNDPRFEGASILLGGNNFGCGSSREHAPQAILRAGYTAVIAGSFAEIFFGNSTNLGIVCVTASDADRATLASAIDADPSAELTIDIVAGEIRWGDNSVPCAIKKNAYESLTSGNFDPLDELLNGAETVAAVAEGLSYMRKA